MNQTFGDPNGIRTRATAVKGQRPRPLNDGAYKVWNFIAPAIKTSPLLPFLATQKRA